MGRKGVKGLSESIEIREVLISLSALFSHIKWGLLKTTALSLWSASVAQAAEVVKSMRFPLY